MQQPGVMMVLVAITRMVSSCSFHSDVVRLLFQAFILEFLMLVDRRRIDIPKHDSIAEEEEKDSSVRQPVLIYRRFMRLLAESGGRTRSVSFFANQLNVNRNISLPVSKRNMETHPSPSFTKPTFPLSDSSCATATKASRKSVLNSTFPHSPSLASSSGSTWVCRPQNIGRST